MRKHFDYRPYRRQFRHPLHSPFGEWRIRKGFILRLENDDGVVGFGEVAPIPWFGTETLEAAEKFLAQAAQGDFPQQVPVDLPCCQFAISCAGTVLRQDCSPPEGNRESAALLPVGASSLNRMVELSTQGFKTFKWKVGTATFEEERELFDELIRELPSNGLLRIDANGSWNLLEAWKWLESLEVEGQVEFVEDPLEPALWEASFGLSEVFDVSLGLDLPMTPKLSCALKEKNWPGFLVLKPSLFGCTKDAVEVAANFPSKTIFSSSLETGFGYEAVLRLAIAEGDQSTVLGMGGQDLFVDDGLRLHSASSVLEAGTFGFETLEEAWAELS